MDSSEQKCNKLKAEIDKMLDTIPAESEDFLIFIKKLIKSYITLKKQP